MVDADLAEHGLTLEGARAITARFDGRLT
jgi:hypothetical protein